MEGFVGFVVEMVSVISFLFWPSWTNEMKKTHQAVGAICHLREAVDFDVGLGRNSALSSGRFSRLELALLCEAV